MRDGFEAEREARQEEPEQRIDHGKGKKAVGNHFDDPRCFHLPLAGDGFLEVELVPNRQAMPASPLEAQMVRVPARIVVLHPLKEREAGRRRSIDGDLVLEREIVKAVHDKHGACSA